MGIGWTRSSSSSPTSTSASGSNLPTPYSPIPLHPGLDLTNPTMTPRDESNKEGGGGGDDTIPKEHSGQQFTAMLLQAGTRFTLTTKLDAQFRDVIIPTTFLFYLVFDPDKRHASLYMIPTQAFDHITTGPNTFSKITRQEKVVSQHFPFKAIKINSDNAVMADLYLSGFLNPYDKDLKFHFDGTQVGFVIPKQGHQFKIVLGDPSTGSSSSSGSPIVNFSDNMKVYTSSMEQADFLKLLLYFKKMPTLIGLYPMTKQRRIIPQSITTIWYPGFKFTPGTCTLGDSELRSDRKPGTNEKELGQMWESFFHKYYCLLHRRDIFSIYLLKQENTITSISSNITGTVFDNLPHLIKFQMSWGTPGAGLTINDYIMIRKDTLLKIYDTFKLFGERSDATKLFSSELIYHEDTTTDTIFNHEIELASYRTVTATAHTSTTNRPHFLPSPFNVISMVLLPHIYYFDEPILFNNNNATTIANANANMSLLSPRLSFNTKEEGVDTENNKIVEEGEMDSLIL